MIELNSQLFDWNEDKNLTNIKKHGVAFREAATVFKDERATMRSDTEHSENEERFRIIGVSENTRLLTVCHCYRDEDSVIRIISARQATKKEEKTYRR